MDKRVLVTGGSGFIASHLVHRLVNMGATVNITARYGNVIKCSRLRDIWDRIGVYEADVRNRGALDVVNECNPDIVFHLAAYNHVGQSWVNSEEAFDVNGRGTVNVLDVIKSPKYVYLSSSEVYGSQDTVPFYEAMTPKPQSPYAIGKYAGELYCHALQRAGKKNISIVRSFNVYGPWQSSKAILPEIIIKCLRGDDVKSTKGEQTREYVYVDDAVDGLIRASLAEYNGPANLAQGYEITIADAIRTIWYLSESKSNLLIGDLPYRDNEIWRMCGSGKRAFEEFRWKPHTNFADGIKRTVEWYKQNMREVSA